MSIEIGTNASKEYLDSRYSNNNCGFSQDEMNITTKSLLDALDLCLSNNFFKFNSQVYKQDGGVGTGIKLAPPFACLGVGKFEKMAFESKHELVDLILLWKQYIDDVFLLYSDSEGQRKNLVNWLNTLMPGVV